jgi:hypothetical protein
MEQYIGVKLINAEPMNRLDYSTFRGWELPADENGSDEGCLVEYVDGGKPNTDKYTDYVSWSPKDVFDNAYRKCVGMTIGLAVEALKMGKKVARAGWNGTGTGMWIGLVEDTYAIAFANPEGGELENYENHPYLVLKSMDGTIVPWAASQTDMLAEDYYIVG